MLRALLIVCLLLISFRLSAVSAVADAERPPAIADADRLLAVGRAAFEHRQAARAEVCFDSVARMTAADVRQRVRALNNLGCTYKFLRHDYVRAYDHLSRAYQLCDSAGYDAFLPVIMVNLGDLISDYSATSGSPELEQQAREMFGQCLERGFANDQWELVTTAFFNLSNGHYELPLGPYRRILSSEIPDSTPDLQFTRLQLRAFEQLQQGRYAEARALFMQQPAAVSARWEPVRDSIAAYMNIAHTYHMEDDYARELAWLDEARQLADRSDVSDLAATISHRLVEARARLLDDRQRLQQYVILAIALALVAVLASAVLLWRKNRQLRQKGRRLYEQYQQLLQADREEQQLRRSLAEAKYSRSNLTSEQRDSLLDRIHLVLADAGEVCQPEFTLAKLSKLVDSNTTYVSQAINEHYGTSFSNVLSGLRVREACRRISQEGDRYRHVTIEAIATDVGFKSRTAFTAAFKRETGLMPSEYLRMALARE